MISWGTIATLAVLGAADPGAAPPDPSGTGASLRSEVSLPYYVALFLAADPEWRVASIERSIAELRVARSEDRLQLDVGARPEVGGSHHLAHAAGTERDMGQLSTGALGFRMRDPFGGELDVRAEAGAVTGPPLLGGGGWVGASAGYRLPLRRNQFGQLYEMETEALRAAGRVQGAQAQALRLARCGLAVSIYLDAYIAQEEARIWGELLSLKEKTYQRTRQDFARRMIPRLDFLAAESDWLAAQQQIQLAQAKLERARATLWEQVPAQQRRLADEVAVPEDSVLTADPEAPPDSLSEEVLGAHPEVAAVRFSGEEVQGRLDLVARQGWTELHLIPQVGADYGTNVFQPDGSLSDETRLSAVLGLSISFPAVDPDLHYREAILRERAQQVAWRDRAVRRDLRELWELARYADRYARSRLELAAQKREVLADQLREAGARYAAGRLEFQDYLQHWEAYQSSRFEELGLRAEIWRAQVDAMRASGQPAPVCGSPSGP